MLFTSSLISEDDGHDGLKREQDTHRVEGARIRVAGFAQQHRCGDEKDGHDRDVDQEDRSPVEVLEQ
ncbi:hypothetical protein [Corynebacterium sp.]|uniref:hypothetical protein n=1 Tax=Corynebacterium TaxID=1716 RepID=UPI002647D1D5|nr:hypothetical protein [Corynebacterium sp.]MDN6367659.1 hypothetical protein [Corynebacterium sp.]